MVKGYSVDQLCSVEYRWENTSAKVQRIDFEFVYKRRIDPSFFPAREVLYTDKFA